MKKSMEEQTSAFESIRAVTACLDSRVTVMENHSGVPEPTTGAERHSSGGALQESPARPARSAPPAAESASSPAWSLVVREGRRQKALDPKNSGPKPRMPSSRRERKTPGIVGTGAGSNICAIRTKLLLQSVLLSPNQYTKVKQ
uniref:Uncharacterized protein n=1 Tax=Knipowitschia caucasica TaxID=637954 RepID=A0AAV2MRG9_KNICA